MSGKTQVTPKAQNWIARTVAQLGSQAVDRSYTRTMTEQ